MRRAAKLWLILGGVHLVLWPALLYAAFNRVDLRHLAFVCFFTVPLAQAVAISSAAGKEAWFELASRKAQLLLLIDAALCGAVLLGLDVRAIAAAIFVKAVFLAMQKRLVLAAAATAGAVHIATNLSNAATLWLDIRSDAIRWMIGFTVLNLLLLLALFRYRGAGGAPFPAMLGYAIVLCNYFLHPYLTVPWTAIAPTMYSAAFTLALRGDQGRGSAT